MTLHISRTRRAVALLGGSGHRRRARAAPRHGDRPRPRPPAVSSAKAGDSAGPELSYIVNLRPGQGTSARVQRAVAEAGGRVLQAYDRIGVLVVHSANADFAQDHPRGQGRRFGRGDPDRAAARAVHHRCGHAEEARPPRS